MKRNMVIAMLIAILLSACSGAVTDIPADVTIPLATEAAVPPANIATTLTEINVCYSAPTTTQAVPWYAFEKGVFEKYGLKVNLVRMQASSKAVTALITGDVVLCEAAGNSVVNAVAAKQDVVMIAGIYNTYPAILVAKSEIKTIDDLRGKKIGTGNTGSASEAATRLAVRELGLDPGVDVTLVEIGEEPDRVAAFRVGQIDALLTSPPYLHKLRADGVSELYDFGKVSLPYAHTSIITTRKFIDENRPTVINFMKAIIESIAMMKKDPEGTKGVIAKYLGLDPVANEADLIDAYENVVLPLIQDVPYPNKNGMQTLIGLAVESNPDVASISPGQLVDESIIKELDDSGFIADILKK